MREGWKSGLTCKHSVGINLKTDFQLAHFEREPQALPTDHLSVLSMCGRKESQRGGWLSVLLGSSGQQDKSVRRELRLDSILCPQLM